MAKSHRAVTAMDGAEVMNAVVKTGISAALYPRLRLGVDQTVEEPRRYVRRGAGAGSEEFCEHAWHGKADSEGRHEAVGILGGARLYAWISAANN